VPDQTGADVTIGANVTIHDGVVLGDGVIIQDGAVLGKAAVVRPGSRASGDARGPLVVAAGATIGAGAVVYVGARVGAGAVVGDQAHVREGVVLGEETIVGRGAALGADVTVGARVRIAAHAWLTNWTEVEDDIVIGPGVITLNDDTMARLGSDKPLRPPRLRRACRIGAAAVLTPGTTVGEEARVEPGSLVARDVPPRAVVHGVPARVVG
jgi:acetyltransferase-like isoleucine patch superfamily enzyme